MKTSSFCFCSANESKFTWIPHELCERRCMHANRCARVCAKCKCALANYFLSFSFVRECWIVSIAKNYGLLFLLCGILCTVPYWKTDEGMKWQAASSVVIQRIHHIPANGVGSSLSVELIVGAWKQFLIFECFAGSPIFSSSSRV